jgi:hypothetical protein
MLISRWYVDNLFKTTLQFHMSRPKVVTVGIKISSDYKSSFCTLQNKRVNRQYKSIGDHKIRQSHYLLLMEVRRLLRRLFSISLLAEVSICAGNSKEKRPLPRSDTFSVAHVQELP